MTTRDKAKSKSRLRYSDPREKAEKHTSGYERTAVTLPDGMPVFAFKRAGTYRLDIIPYSCGEGNPNCEPGLLHWERTYFSHRDIGSNGDSFICLKRTFGKPCPVCEAQAKLRQGNADPDLIKALAPKERQLFNVIDCADADRKLSLLDISYHLFGKLLDTKLKNADDDDGYENFPRLDKGMTLKLGVEEKSFGGRTFYEVKDIEFRPRKVALDESLAEEAACLDDLLIETPYKKLKSIFLESEAVDQDDDDDDDDDDKPAKGKKAPAKTKPGKKKPAPVDDDDDDDVDDGSELEDDDDDSDDDDSVVVDDDDDDDVDDGSEVVDDDDDDDQDLDDDEDDDDPAPPKKRPGKKAPPKKKPAKRKPRRTDDDEDDEDDD